MPLMAAALIVCSASLTSCKKSNADLIDDYRDLCKEVVEATKDGNLVKVASLAEKGQKLEAELKERDLTDDEKAELLQIEQETAAEAADAAVTGTSKMMESATDALESASDVMESAESLLKSVDSDSE